MLNPMEMMAGGGGEISSSGGGGGGAGGSSGACGVGVNHGHAIDLMDTSSYYLLAAGATVMGEYGGHDMPDTKEGIEELCPVCGDKVSGYHYGLLTCESCKGFFKRTVQNKKVYTCVAERSCHIDKSQRKRCPYCRFQKCLDVGMKLEAVRADRMRGGRNKFGPMYKRDRARKLQLMRQKQLAAQQTRAPCQLNPNEANQQGTNNGNNNGTSSVASTMASALPGGFSYLTTTGGGTTGSGAGSGYGGGPTIKQELIQIPQLSSSTSSPDSSPSPLPNQHHPHHHHMHQQQQQPHHLHLHHHHMQQQQQQQHHHHLHHNHHHHQMMVDGGGGGGGNSSSSNSPIANGPSTVLHSPPSDHHHKGVVHWVNAAAGGPQTTPTSSGVSPATGGGGGGASAASPKAPSAAFQYDSVSVAVALGGPGAAVATSALAKVPALIREFQQSSVDDKEWQNQLFALLQNQTYNQCEVDLFELMCKVLDHSLFAQVDWARNSIFFKDLKVDDQMKLLQHSWSDMLIMDHIHHRLHNNLPDESTLPNGQKFDLLALAVLGLPALVEQFNDLSSKLQDLKFDSVDYICLKFMILLNPDVRGLMNRKHIHDAHEQVKQALLEYSIECYPQIQDKFGKLMQLVPELHMLSLRGEEFLYFKHLGGGAPTQTLLMEMLHAKKK